MQVNHCVVQSSRECLGGINFECCGTAAPSSAARSWLQCMIGFDVLSLMRMVLGCLQLGCSPQEQLVQASFTPARVFGRRNTVESLPVRGLVSLFAECSRNGLIPSD